MFQKICWGISRIFCLQMSKLSSIINFAKSAIEDVEKKNAKSKTKVLFFVNQILFGEKNNANNLIFI